VIFEEFNMSKRKQMTSAGKCIDSSFTEEGRPYSATSVCITYLQKQAKLTIKRQLVNKLQSTVRNNLSE